MKGVHALVVLCCGEQEGDALMCDFLAASQRLIDNGLEPTCLSTFDLAVAAETYNGFKFGRDDLAGRTRTTYTFAETKAKSDNDARFYEIVPVTEMKTRILAWFAASGNQMQSLDRALIFFSAHGSPNGSIVIGAGGRISLTKTELTTAMKKVPPNSRVFFMSNSCYAGHLSSIATDCNEGTKTFFHLGCGADETTPNFRSLSDRYRCGTWTAAILEEWKVNPEGQIIRYLKQVEDECAAVDIKYQPIRATPCSNFSDRSLRATALLCYWKPSPEVSTKGHRRDWVTLNPQRTPQQLHEIWLKALAGARAVWRSFPGAPPPSGPGASNCQDFHLQQAFNNIEEEGDNQLHGFRDIIKIVIEKKGPRHLKRQVLNTLQWIEETELSFYEMLKTLVRREILENTISEYPKEKRPQVIEKFRTAAHEIREFLECNSEGFMKLQGPSSEDCISIYFLRYSQELVKIAAWHQVKYNYFNVHSLLSPLQEFLNPIALDQHDDGNTKSEVSLQEEEEAIAVLKMIKARGR